MTSDRAVPQGSQVNHLQRCPARFVWRPGRPPEVEIRLDAVKIAGTENRIPHWKNPSLGVSLGQKIGSASRTSLACCCQLVLELMHVVSHVDLEIVLSARASDVLTPPPLPGSYQAGTFTASTPNIHDI